MQYCNFAILPWNKYNKYLLQVVLIWWTAVLYCYSSLNLENLRFGELQWPPNLRHCVRFAMTRWDNFDSYTWTLVLVIILKKVNSINFGKLINLWLHDEWQMNEIYKPILAYAWYWQSSSANNRPLLNANLAKDLWRLFANYLLS